MLRVDSLLGNASEWKVSLSLETIKFLGNNFKKRFTLYLSNIPISMEQFTKQFRNKGNYET